MTGHNIIVIGASVGGVETLSNLVAQFPEDLPATIFVVQHILPTATGRLAQILDRAGPLPATQAQDGASFEPSHIYVAPPDHHLLVKQGCLRVTRGLRENRVRPAIDPLFRSAAVAYGARVVGVVLTGMQNDGTAGLLAIKRCGGIAMVQDPTDALYPDMPRSALESVEVDYCLPVLKMGTVLYRLAQELPVETPPIPEDLLIEVDIAEDPTDSRSRIEELGASASLTCPECSGPLWELRDAKLRRYRCRLGHAFTAESLLAGQSEVIEYALWAAVRTMEERVHILRSLAHGRREHGQSKLADLYETQAKELRTQAQQIRQMLLEAWNPSLEQ
jgi:two-component system, chemotaxis family, protein-glutamate methylesterase/glutaminase